MKNIFTSTIIMLLCITAYAQQNAAPTLASLPKPKNNLPATNDVLQKPIAQFVSPISVQVLFGSQGIGAVALFKSFPNRLFNMNIDVGTYYLASPGTSFTGTKLLSDNNSQASQFHQNMEGYRWLPVLQLNFNFRIK